MTPADFYGADVYVHHQVYASAAARPARYNIHRPGPYHVHVVQYAGTPYVFYDARAGYYAPPAATGTGGRPTGVGEAEAAVCPAER